MSNKYYSLEIQQVLKELNSTLDGLSSQEASARLAKFGPNQIHSGQKISPLIIFLKQFKNLFTLILIFAILTSLAITFWGSENRIPESCFIFLIIFINATLGFIQNYKAAQGMQALKSMVEPLTTVKRDGQSREVKAVDIVPGDILILSEGLQVPADARLTKVVSLKADESAFTGESVPVSLKTDLLNPDTALQDRNNMVYMGTYITQGNGEAVVTNTGMNTELGKIAQSLTHIKPRKTPFELEVGKLAKQITVAVAFAVGLVAFMASVKGHMGWVDVLILCMGLFVGAIPEAMPAIVTFAMSLGTKYCLRYPYCSKHRSIFGPTLLIPQ